MKFEEAKIGTRVELCRVAWLKLGGSLQSFEKARANYFPGKLVNKYQTNSGFFAFRVEKLNNNDNESWFAAECIVRY